MEHRRFLPRFVVVIGVAALLGTLLHGIEVANWAAAYRLLGALPNNKSAMLYPLSAMTSLWSREPLSRRAMATDGCS
jgi:hypothetical protein